jgi:hypothetical protein
MPVFCTLHPTAVAEGACTRCGDFVCGLCAEELGDAPLCARCAVRSAVAWEARGEESWPFAFWQTWAEAMTSPRRLGLKLGGSGFALAALAYLLLAGIVGMLPLALLLSALSARGADAFTLGIGSTSALSASAAWVFGAVAWATTLVLIVALWALWARALGASVGRPVSLAIVVRVLAYGASLVAVPCAGPLLTPLALSMAGVGLHACLSERSTPRAAQVVSFVGALLGASLLLVGVAVWSS